MSKSCILIFAKSASAIEPVVQALEKQGVRVLVETHSSGFFDALAASKPNKIFISVSVNSGLKSMLYSYVKRRYRIPVYSFNEPESEAVKADDDSPKQRLSNGVLHLNYSDLLLQSEKTDWLESNSLAHAEKAQNSSQQPELPVEFHLFFEKINEQLNMTDKFTQAESFDLYSLLVESDADCFQLSMTVAHLDTTEEQRKNIVEQIRAQLEEQFAADIEVHVYRTSVDKNFVDRLRNSYEFPLLGKMQEVELGLFARAHNQNNIINYDWNEEAQLFMVPVEVWMTEGILDFHVYIWMPENKHRVLYAKKGNLMAADQFTRLQARTNESLAIDPSEIKNYQLSRLALQL